MTQQNCSKDIGCYEAIIIGGGIMGSVTAYYLSKELGKNVLLLEQYEFFHKKGSSHGDSRIIRKTYPQEHYTELMLDAYKLWAIAEKEGETTVFTQTGGLDISHKDNEIIKQLIASSKKYDLPVEIMTPAETKNKFPSITIPENNVGVYSPDSGILNATKAVALFQCLAKMNGCVLRDNTVITEIVQSDDDRKTIFVKTNEGKMFACSKCIVTAGPWTKTFLKKINIDLPLKPFQTTVGFWPVNSPSTYSSSVFPVFIKYDPELFVYGIPAHEFPNMIKCCAHVGPEVDPDNRNFLLETDKLTKLVAPFIQETFKDVKTVPAYTESCIYTWTPDEDFIVDELPGYNGIFVGCGFSGHGFKLAPVVGKILSQLALSKPHPYPKVRQYFSIERFKQKSKL